MVSLSFTEKRILPADGAREAGEVSRKVSHGVLYRTRETLKLTASPTVHDESKKYPPIFKVSESFTAVMKPSRTGKGVPQ